MCDLFIIYQVLAPHDNFHRNSSNCNKLILLCSEQNRSSAAAAVSVIFVRDRCCSWTIAPASFKKDDFFVSKEGDNGVKGNLSEREREGERSRRKKQKKKRINEFKIFRNEVVNY